jgi:penicillin-binding protein 1C
LTPQKTKRPVLKIICLILAGLFLLLIILYLSLAYLLPIPVSLSLGHNNISTKIFDRHGQLLYEVLSPKEGRKTYLQLNQIPQLFIDAVISSEDKDFYQHGGVDFSAISRALFYNSLEQKITSGASTITQQLVRNLLGTNRQRNLQEKLVEAAYAIRLSHAYSKDQILEQYLNTIYFGNLSYGVAEASQNFFGKDLSNLDLAEISLLAGLPQSPGNYNPLTNLPKAKKRQKYVLDSLVGEGHISTTEAEQAWSEQLRFDSGKTVMEAPHFVHQVLADLEEKYGADLLYSGLQIKTTLDLNLQKKAQQIIDYQLEKLHDKNVGNAALLSVDIPSGQVLVWLGSKDFFNNKIAGQVDLITSLRQPGSALKPFLYLLALQQGETLASIIEDLPFKVKTEGGVYAPLNYDLDFHGPVRMREALANSFNIPAVRTQEKLGTQNFLNFLQRLGLDSLDQKPDYYGLALTLGGGEIRLVDLANAYFTLANYGYQKPFSNILEINGPDGVNIYKWNLPLSRNILGAKAEQISYLIISALSDSNARLRSFGEGNVLELSVPAAVKTGTTRNFRDNWTFGFSPSILTAVWVGNSDATAMENISGIDGAGPIWHDFMEYFQSYHPSPSSQLDFSTPAGLRQVSICAISGLLPGANCQESILEWFISGTEPQKNDHYWQKFSCPQRDGAHTEKYFPVFPYPYQSWAQERGFVASPECRQITFSTAAPAHDSPPLRFISPLAGDTFQITRNLPLESQKIPLKIVFDPGLLISSGQDFSQLQLQIDGLVIKNLDIINLKSPLEVQENWLPTTGEHVLKVLILSNQDQKLASSEQKFVVN